MTTIEDIKKKLATILYDLGVPDSKLTIDEPIAEILALITYQKRALIKEIMDGLGKQLGTHPENHGNYYDGWNEATQSIRTHLTAIKEKI